MCRQCIIFTYDEVLGIIQRLEVGAPLTRQPDWPAALPQAFPNSLVPIIIPRFDTARSGISLAPGSLEVRQLSWGFQEDWKPGVVFNTRIESAAKPMWRDSMDHRRCIIPVAGFFESHREETMPSPRTGRPIKRLYECSVPGQDVILIGGIWRENRFSMVTAPANRAMEPVHHRMPLVLAQEELPLWLGPDYGSLADRSSMPLDVRPLQPDLGLGI